MTTPLPDQIQVSVKLDSTHTAELLRMAWNVVTATFDYDIDLTVGVIIAAINRQYGTSLHRLTDLTDQGYTLADIADGSNSADLLLIFDRQKSIP